MKKYLTIVLAIFFFIPIISFAQMKGEKRLKEPATKLEAFLVKKGKLVVKDSYELGEIEGRLGAARNGKRKKDNSRRKCFSRRRRANK